MKRVKDAFDERAAALDGLLGVGRSFDMIGRTLRIGGHRARLWVVNGYADDTVLERAISAWLPIPSLEDVGTLQAFADRYVSVCDAAVETDRLKAVTAVFAGKTLLVIDGFSGGVVLDAKQFPLRSVEEPDTSKVLRGSHDGFVENLMQNAALLLFGSQQMAYPTLVKLGSFSVGGVQVDGITVLTLAVTAVLMAALTLFIDKTKLGKAMRAVSEDKDAATLMGISVDRTITLTFAIGSALAAFASMFYGMTYVYIKPTTGAMPGIKAFTAAVFGGIGSIPGAMLGGILLGLIEQMSKTYISTLWADAIVFAVLVVVLVVKPTGLLGKPMQEKV